MRVTLLLAVAAVCVMAAPQAQLKASAGEVRFADKGVRRAGGVKKARYTTKGDVRINKDIAVAGDLKARSLTTGDLNVTSLTVKRELTARRVGAKLIAADQLQAGIIRSPTGTVTVQGDLQLAAPGSASASFLAMDVTLDGVRQWRLLSHDDFQTGAPGWSMDGTSLCGSPDRFLGGPCVASAASSEKMFSSLPPHSQIRLTARFHFIDSWAGETGFAQMDGRYVWADSCGAAASPTTSMNLCGSDAPERRLSVPIDVTLPHTEETVKVAFGSTLTGDACQQSWGVDDVAIYVR
eukprot:PLAT3142.1.p2 GENE.PLAT3142.1~~PLAT3142.1.p2  ORF type:complete len:294 (-),score=119.95 PLAT3142.1:255-1136(-)